MSGINIHQSDISKNRTVFFISMSVWIFFFMADECTLSNNSSIMTISNGDNKNHANETLPEWQWYVRWLIRDCIIMCHKSWIGSVIMGLKSNIQPTSCIMILAWNFIFVLLNVFYFNRKKTTKNVITVFMV